MKTAETSFQGKNTLGVRHDGQTLCLTDSIRLFPGDQSYLLEESRDTEQVCAHCGKLI